MNPQFPLYIVSKGRYQFGRRLTSRILEEMNVPHFIVVEEQEYAAYSAVVDKAKVTVLVLEKRFQDDYDPCDGLGYAKSKGSGPARNFAWEHSIASGAEWHWVMDDNIYGFYRMHQNRRAFVSDGTIFRCIEDFVLRYTNVAMAGPNYHFFAKLKQRLPPFVANTRIYSCNLIRNDVPFRWRARYNEDTDLSLRMLKAGFCTILFNAFLQSKARTQSIAGGNTDEIYAEGTLAKSKLLAELHPDVCRVVWKFQRWHHYVDYRPFRGLKLIRKPGIEIPSEPNNYGMVLKMKADGSYKVRRKATAKAAEDARDRPERTQRRMGAN